MENEKFLGTAVSWNLKHKKIGTGKSVEDSKYRNSCLDVFYSEAALQRSFQEKLFWKYAADLQENTHAEDCF